MLVQQAFVLPYRLQASAQSSDVESEELDQIVVTGSRIQRADLEKTIPITVINAARDGNAQCGAARRAADLAALGGQPAAERDAAGFLRRPRRQRQPEPAQPGRHSHADPAGRAPHGHQSDDRGSVAGRQRQPVADARRRSHRSAARWRLVDLWIRCRGWRDQLRIEAAHGRRGGEPALRPAAARRRGNAAGGPGIWQWLCRRPRPAVRHDQWHHPQRGAPDRPRASAIHR